MRPLATARSLDAEPVELLRGLVGAEVGQLLQRRLDQSSKGIRLIAHRCTGLLSRGCCRDLVVKARCLAIAPQFGAPRLGSRQCRLRPGRNGLALLFGETRSPCVGR